MNGLGSFGLGFFGMDWLGGILGFGSGHFRRLSAVSVAHFGRILERIHGEGSCDCRVEGRGEG